jgi:hypothetical protein
VGDKKSTDSIDPIRVDTPIPPELLELFLGDAIANFFVHLSAHTLQKRFIALAVSAEEPDMAGVQDAGNVITPLQKKPALDVYEEGASSLAVFQVTHPAASRWSGLAHPFNGVAFIAIRHGPDLEGPNFTSYR